MTHLETFLEAWLGMFGGMVIGAWSARRHIVQQCRKLGGFYVGSTTFKVSEIKAPEYVPPIGLGQVPLRRPPPMASAKRFADGGIVDPNAGTTVEESL